MAENKQFSQLKSKQFRQLNIAGIGKNMISFSRWEA